MLQSFYGNCISACFSPFFILKEISDRKKMTKYGMAEVNMLAAISGIAIILVLWIDQHTRTKYSYSEK